MRNICVFIGICALALSLSVSCTHTQWNTTQTYKRTKYYIVLIRGICLFSSNCICLWKERLGHIKIVVIALTSLSIVNAVSPSLCQVPWKKSFMKETHPNLESWHFLQITGYHIIFNLPKITQEAIIAAAAVVITKKNSNIII